MKNAHSFPDLYTEFDFSINNLGCLMLETDSPYAGTIPKDGQYFSPNPELYWLKGVAETWHVTVRYGFLPGVTRYHVDKVLQSVKIPKFLKVKGLEIFPSPNPNEAYDCVVARVQSLELEEINQQLSVLPNINTFPEYKPHITIGYFEQGFYSNRPFTKGFTNYQNLLDRLPKTVPVLGIDYGKNL